MPFFSCFLITVVAAFKPYSRNLSRRLSQTVTICVVGFWLVVTARIAAESFAQPADLPAVIRAARDDYHPVANEQVAAARSELIQSAEQLDRWMIPGTRVSTGWKRYLEWDRLQQQLAPDGRPDLSALLKTDQKLNVDFPGLELPHFRRLSETIRRYMDVVRAAALADPQETYEAQLEALADSLERYESQPNPRMEAAIGSRLEFLTLLGLSPEVVLRVRQQHARPNAYIDISSKFLTAAASEPIRQVGPVYDTILGTAIRGTAHTSGQVSVHPVPSADRALLEFESAGHIQSRSHGYNDPIVIRSTGYTDFTARKSVEFTDAVFRLLPSQAWATTRTQIHSVNAQRGGPFSGIIARVGTNQVYQDKPRAEAIAADHAEYRIRSEFDEEVLEAVTALRRRYRDEFRYPLIRQGAYPEQVRFNSTSRSVGMELIQASGRQLGASAPPPTVSLENDVVARIHQTAASNYTATAIGGTTLSESESEDRAQFDRILPGWLEDARERIDTSGEPKSSAGVEVSSAGSEPARSWAITFRRVRPISVEFAAGEANLTVHTASLVSGSDRFENWDLLASYELQRQDDGLVLKRSGDIEMFPANFDPTSGRRLSARQVAIRNNLNKVINELTEQGDGLPSMMKMPELELSGELADVGPLRLRSARCENGWLTLSWDLP